MARVLVTGVTGQIGWYLAERMRARGHEVYGLERQTTQGRSGVQPLPYQPIAGDLLDDYSLLSLIEQIQPEQIYNFAAQSFIPASWQQPVLTAQYTGIGVVRLLEAVRRVVPKCRFLQAGSSELFAGGERSPQDESTPVVPRNPYGAAKAFAYHSVRMYREQYGLFAANAIFYTNESPRRTPSFLFRKVTHGAAQIRAGKSTSLTLGSLDTMRDWGYTPDFAEAAAAILAHDRPDDFVIATGKAHSVGDMVARTFARLNLDWQELVRVDPALVRAPEQHVLVGNPDKAARVLGWRPSVDFDGLIGILLAHDLAAHGLALPERSDAPRR